MPLRTKAMSKQYATALSHLVLASISLLCFIKYHKTHPVTFAHGTFGLISANSILGLWRYGNPLYGDNIEGIYQFTSRLQKHLALPGIVATILQKHSNTSYVYFYTILSIATVILCLCKHRFRFTDYVVAVHVLLLAALSVSVENYYGVTTAISYALEHFMVQSYRLNNFDIPTQDLSNYSMCFFAVFANQTVSI